MVRSRNYPRRHSSDGAAPYANPQDLDHAAEHSHVRAELARAMGDPKHSEDDYLYWRAEDSRVRDEVGARSDGRAYGSGVTNDTRGHRHLHHHFESGGNVEHAYSGPRSYHTGGDQQLGSEHVYQHVEHTYPGLGATGEKRVPMWDTTPGKPAHDHSQERRRR
jgi:hypothetical protein